MTDRAAGRSGAGIKSGENGGEGQIAMIAHQQPNKDDHLAAAAVEFQPALRPVVTHPTIR